MFIISLLLYLLWFFTLPIQGHGPSLNIGGFEDNGVDCIRNLSAPGHISYSGYSGSRNCTWILRAQPYQRIYLVVESFDLHVTSPTQCMNYIKIFDGEVHDDNFITDLCGHFHGKRVFVSESSIFSVVMTTNTHNESSKLEASFNAEVYYCNFNTKTECRMELIYSENTMWEQGTHFECGNKTITSYTGTFFQTNGAHSKSAFSFNVKETGYFEVTFKYGSLHCTENSDDSNLTVTVCGKSVTVDMNGTHDGHWQEASLNFTCYTDFMVTFTAITPSNGDVIFIDEVIVFQKAHKTKGVTPLHDSGQYAGYIIAGACVLILVIAIGFSTCLTFRKNIGGHIIGHRSMSANYDHLREDATVDLEKTSPDSVTI